MKIAVYTIALNEEKHVARWFDSAKEADLLVIADTGSIDKTVGIARSLGISVTSIEVNPWRFDVARNASLALIPEDIDICVQLDMDEVLPIGWREKVEEAWQKGNVWPTYSHVTRRYSDGKKRDFQHYFKIHPRKGFAWKYPIHEVIEPVDGSHYQRKYIDLEVDHLQDKSKSRKSYLELLQTAVLENPEDWRMNHYLCREYYYLRRWDDVLSTANRSLDLVIGWNIEASATYMWASEAAWILGHKVYAEYWADRATQQAPEFFEAWYWKAHIMQLLGKWQNCFDSISRKFLLSRQNHHLVNSAIWEWKANDLYALSLYKLGFYDLALFWGLKSLEFNPSDSRLQENVKYYFGKAASQLNEKARSASNSRNSEIEYYEEFPPIFYLNLNTSTERLSVFQNACNKYGIGDRMRFIAKPTERKYGISSFTNLDLALHSDLRQNHLDMYESFLNTNFEYALVCEDDINFDSATHWPFVWKHKFLAYRNLEFDAIQLSCITSKRELFIPSLHLRREGVNWSSGATLVNRQGARKIIENIKSSDLSKPLESQIYDGLKVYTDPIFTCDSDSNSLLHPQDIDLYHKHSFEEIRSYMKKVTHLLNQPLLEILK